MNGFIPTLAALLLTILPLGEPITERVDRIEVNHYQDETGKEIGPAQAIVWRWNPATCEYEVRAWWMVKCESDMPSRDMLRFDGRTMRRIKTNSVIETWSNYDREVEERKRLPVDQRRGLITEMRKE